VACGADALAERQPRDVLCHAALCRIDSGIRSTLALQSLRRNRQARTWCVQATSPMFIKLGQRPRAVRRYGGICQTVEQPATVAECKAEAEHPRCGSCSRTRKRRAEALLRALRNVSARFHRGSFVIERVPIWHCSSA